MKSIPWLGRPTRRHGFAALLSAAALALGMAGCTKDAESRAPTTASEGAPAAAQAQAPAADPNQAQAAAAEGAAPGAAVPVAGGGAAGSGQNADDDTYALKIEAPNALANGADGTVRVSVVPAKGWKMNKEFPTKLEVTAPAGVTVAKAKQSIGDAERFEDAGATFAVPFKAESAGEKAFQAKLKFAVCTDATCTPKTRELAWVVNVE